MDSSLLESDGELNISPSKSSSQSDFDFLVGKWKIHNKKLKSRLSNCTEWTEFEALAECHEILKGFGNIDSYRTLFDNVPFEGMSLRLFNPKTRLWSIYWADSNVVVLDVPVVGSFDGKIGTFYTRDVWEGQRILVAFRWDKTNHDVPLWSQAFSSDEGKTWEWNWYMTFHRHD